MKRSLSGCRFITYVGSIICNFSAHALFNGDLAALKRMGVETTYEVLLNAKTSAIHYAKNILLD